jgi:hypothetical protein
LLRRPRVAERAGIFEISARFLLGPCWRWLPDDGRWTAFGHTFGHTPHDAKECLVGARCAALRAVKRIDDVGLRSGVRFAVMALVVLPLLPEGPYGPFGGVRPCELWALVLFFSGLSVGGLGAPGRQIDRIIVRGILNRLGAATACG